MIPCADAEEVKINYDITLANINNTTNKVDSLIVAVGHDEFRQLDSVTL